MGYHTMYDIQKASILKRVSAWILDVILLAVLAVGCAWVFSDIVGYDDQQARLDAYYDQYAKQYNTSFHYSVEEFEALSEEERTRYESAYKAFMADEAAVDLYVRVPLLSILTISVGVVLACLVLEFLIPLLLGNGQTIGKKVFSIAVMRTHGVKIEGVCLFIRSILGKCAIETMIPVLIVNMLGLGMIGISGTVIVAALLLAQGIMVIVTQNNALLHDLMADTVVVDMSTQKIFNSDQERLEYQQREAAEKAERQRY